ncbi:MAG: histidine kinase,HAMP proteinhistidine kinase,cache [Geminicoccaceae bacterium]|nr:histidine kinase,HAMP proteinhistidine kinase,cache [Geminicoccaceae bacterium]
MSLASAVTSKGSARAEGQRAHGRLFRRYVVLLVALVAGVLIISGGLSIYFTYQREKGALAQIQQEKAVAAAAVIRQFIEEIQNQIGWTTQLSLLPDAAGIEQRRIDYYRLLRQAPAITEIAFIDGSGREQLRVSRLAMDVVSSQADLSDEPAVRSAREAGAYFGPVYFRKESEPYMMLAVRGSGKKGDVTIAEINLKFIRDVISGIRVGKEGYAYVVDAEGRLVAHPDLALVLRKTDLSTLPQVRDVTAAPGSSVTTSRQTTASIGGGPVLSAHAAIAPLNWHVFVETPLAEALAPLYTTMLWNAGLLLLGLAIAVLASLFLARNLIGPIRALQEGAGRIGRGDLRSRIDIKTGDELQALAEHFNQMAGQLQESYANLEGKVEERTRQLARSVSELEALGEVSRAVNSSLELETVLARILAHACTFADAGGGAIYVAESETARFRIAATHGMDDELVRAIRALPVRLGDTVVGQCVAQRDAAQIPDLAAEPAYPLHAAMIKAGIRALLGVPLLREGEVIGALIVRRKRTGPFADDTVDLVKSFAAQSSLAIYNARLFHELAQKSRELEAASRHKSEFLANMSHELRTPLNAVLGYAELMQDGIYGEVPEKIHAVLERVQQNGRHLLGLINDVLDLSKIEAGQLTLAPVEYSLRELVLDVVSATEALAAEKRLALEVEVAADLPHGQGDERRLTQVLMNLVGNAIKFTDAGKVGIRAKVEDGSFRVEVQDTGPGIAPADRERIFEEFQQVDTSSTRRKGGTGLGLAIARRIVELHGGRIWVDVAA